MSDNLWQGNAIPSQAGKVMIVTGATSRIGYEAALALAKAKAAVVLASMNEAKGNMTLEKIIRLQRSALCALIPVASLSHKRTHLHFDDLQLKQHYNPMTACSQSKLAVLTSALELSRRLADNGSDIKVIPVHPGVAATSDEVKNGAYYGPGGIGEHRGIPAPAKIAPLASDRENAARLWRISEELIQVKYSF